MNARKKYFTSDIIFTNPTKIFNILKTSRGKELIFRSYKISYLSKTYLTFMKIDRGDLKILYLLKTVILLDCHLQIIARENNRNKNTSFLLSCDIFFLPCFLVKKPDCNSEIN